MSGDFVSLEGKVLSYSHNIATCECDVAGKKHRVIARRAGRLANNHIRIVAGDRVTVEVSPYDLTRGRITYRLDGNS